MKIYGAIEAGGTKFVCGVGTDPADLRTVQFPTTTPEATLGAAARYLRAEAGPDLASVGIGSFGPVDLDPASPTHGWITTTPKSGWRNTEVAGAIGRALRVPVAIDTDVNAAALGELRWGAAQGLASCLYLTVGTGIGGGAVFDGRLLHGLTHPEMGHIRIPRDPADPFHGCCPFHGDCLEGLASGAAMRARWGVPGYELPPDHPAWALEARYLALALANFAFTLSPERIIVGGGVMRHEALYPAIQAELSRLLNAYMPAPQVVPPELGDRAGVLGALALAQQVSQ